MRGKVSGSLSNVKRRRILDFVAVKKLPAMYEFRYYVRDGGLMSYGPTREDPVLTLPQPLLMRAEVLE